MSDMTYGQLQSALQAAITASLPEDDEDSYVWVYDFSDSFVIYCCSGEYMQDDYSLDGDGNVTLAGAPVPVRPVTTYEPVSEGKSAPVRIEMRGLAAPERLGELLGQRQLDSGRIRVNSEPLTYYREGRHSFYRDMVLDTLRPGTFAGAAERLRRHRQEMDVVGKERTERAWRAFRAGELEYRVEPNRTDGQGGYFSPPAWLNDLFATAKRPGRVLSALIPGRFPLPDGVSSINLPVISTGTAVQPTHDTAAGVDQSITDAAGSSTVATFQGREDVALQLLEQSPAGAHLDWVIFTDLTAAYDYDLETQLISGAGTASDQLLGVLNMGGQSIGITYTSASPTGSEMWPYFGKAAGQLGDARLLPPEVWLMRTARWAWLNTQEDTANRPFSLPSPFFMGMDDYTPDPVGGLIGWPTFLTEAIPANLSGNPGSLVTGGTQDVVICLRPSDYVFLESMPVTSVMLEPGSGNLSARLQLRGRAASIARYTAGIAVIGGTGNAVVTGY